MLGMIAEAENWCVVPGTRWWRLAEATQGSRGNLCQDKNPAACYTNTLTTEYRKEEKLVSESRNFDTKYEASLVYTQSTNQNVKSTNLESNINPLEGERVS